MTASFDIGVDKIRSRDERTLGAVPSSAMKATSVHSPVLPARAAIAVAAAGMTALLAGGMLAFALSFDEVIVTIFTAGLDNKTLPIWIYEQLFRPRERPITNVAAVLVMVVTAIPVLAAYYLTRDAEHTAGGGK